MEGIRVLHTGDLHLGTSFAHSKLPGRIGRIRRQELWETFNEIIELVKRERVQLLLIAGDLLEYSYCSTADARRIDRKFREVEDVHICISPGNHDPAVADALYNTYGWSTNVHIFRQEKIEKISFDDIGAAVWGLGWERGEIRQPLLEGFSPVDDSIINILLLHCDVVAGGKETVYLPVSPAQLANSGVHYAVLGHIHKKGEIIHNGRIVGRYSGSPVFIGSLGRDMCSIKFRPIAKRRFVHKTIQVQPSYTVDQVIEAVRDTVNQEGKNNLFRFELVGNLDEEIKLDTHYLIETAGAFFACVVDSTQPDYDLASIAEDGGNRISRIFVARVLERIEKESDQEKRDILERALYRKVIVK